MMLDTEHDEPHVHTLKSVTTSLHHEFLLCPTRPAGWKMMRQPIALREEVPMQHLLQNTPNG